MKKNEKTGNAYLPNMFHWVNVNTTWNKKMTFSTTQFKMDHGIEYAHFEKVKSVVIERNLCGYCLN